MAVIHFLYMGRTELTPTDIKELLTFLKSCWQRISQQLLPNQPRVRFQPPRPQQARLSPLSLLNLPNSHQPHLHLWPPLNRPRSHRHRVRHSRQSPPNNHLPAVPRPLHNHQHPARPLQHPLPTHLQPRRQIRQLPLHRVLNPLNLHQLLHRHNHLRVPNRVRALLPRNRQSRQRPHRQPPTSRRRQQLQALHLNGRCLGAPQSFHC